MSLNKSINEKIRILTIVAIVSDDFLMETLVLKGGTAIELMYKLSSRSSVDVDFSMAGEFSPEQQENIRAKLPEVLNRTFGPEGYHVFDIKFVERPHNLNEDLRDFWGGYKIEFKVVSQQEQEKVGSHEDALRRNALVIGFNHRRTFRVDISKYEYVQEKQELELNYYTVPVYTLDMIVLEKIRALCQQLPEYKNIVPTHKPRGRGRDVYDIFVIAEKCQLDFTTSNTVELLEKIFAVKKVPLSFLQLLETSQEFHKADFESLRDTVPEFEKLQPFDFYFDYLMEKIKLIAG